MSLRAMPEWAREHLPMTGEDLDRMLQSTDYDGYYPDLMAWSLVEAWDEITRLKNEKAMLRAALDRLYSR